MIRVLVDTCLLVKGTVSNVLFDLNKNELISLHWTPEIGVQFVDNWAGSRVDKEIRRRARNNEPLLTPTETAALDSRLRANARSRLSKFELMAPEWRIPGWNCALVGAAHSKASLGVGQRGGTGVHDGDYEVALAAIRLAELFPDDEIWLATENIHHLPPSMLVKFNVWSLHQGLLLEELYNVEPSKVQASLELTLSETGFGNNPKLTKDDMLRVLASAQEFASPMLEANLAKA